MADDIHGMDVITSIVEERNGDIADGYHPTGAVILSIYTQPDGGTLMCSTRIGGLNCYTEEGMLRSALRRIESMDDWEASE